MRHLSAAAVTIGSVLALAAPAFAADPIPASVRVDAPASCMTTSAFWSALGRRTDRLREARAGEESVSIEVTMRSDADGGAVAGELRIVRSGSASEQRRLSAASCDELIHAMSLVAALAFDPAARLDPAIEPRESTPSTSPAPAPAPSAPAEAPPRAPGNEAPAFRFGIGLSAGGTSVSNELAAPMLGGFVDLRHERGLLTTLRLGFARSSASVTRESVVADLAWTVGRFAVCPIRMPLNARGSLSLMPCAGIDAGVLSAAASGVSRAADESRLWLAASAMGRFEIEPVRLFFIEAQVGAGFPFIRDEIAVDPRLTLYRAPPVIVIGEIGAGVRFP